MSAEDSIAQQIFRRLGKTATRIQRGDLPRTVTHDLGFGHFSVETLTSSSRPSELEADLIKAQKDTPLTCPFCGDDPGAMYVNRDLYEIRCNSLFCGINPVIAKPSRSGALLAWNQRHSP